MNKRYKNIADSYLEALRRADLEGVLDLFADDAIVVSPVYGKMGAAMFYQGLFKDTMNSVVIFKDIFTCVDKLRRIALHFSYEWTLSNASVLLFDVVDIIDLNKTGKIEKINIIYDAAQARSAIKNIQSSAASKIDLTLRHDFFKNC